ncbi:MAG: gas vesicle protein GvpD P-loop domain-containing protein [Candidatus Hodarchaeota archaeon]
MASIGTGDLGSLMPSEIASIFEGRSFFLLVKGLTGTGKTLFSLELAMHQPKVLYLSTRQPVKVLNSNYSWILDHPAHIEFFGPLVGEKDAKNAKEMLISRVETPSNDQSKPMIVIDSWEGLISLDEDQDWCGMITKLRELAFENSVNVVVVSEWDDSTYLDSIADHVLLLRDEEYNSCPMRLLSIQKLSGHQRGKKDHVFTLKNARFRSFSRFVSAPLDNLEKIELIHDKEGYYSSGIPDLDGLLGGGFRMGTFNLVEVDHDLPKSLDVLLLFHMNNFLKQERGVLLSPATPHNECKMMVVQIAGPLILNDYLRVMEERILVTPENRPYVISLNDKESEFFNVFQEAYDYLEEKTNFTPVFTFIEYNPVSFRSEKYLKGLLKHMHFVNNANIIELAVINAVSNAMASREEMMVYEMMKHQAENHFKLSRVGDAVVFTDLKKERKNYALELEATPSRLVVRFNEII